MCQLVRKLEYYGADGSGIIAEELSGWSLYLVWRDCDYARNYLTNKYGMFSGSIEDESNIDIPSPDREWIWM